MAEFFQRKIKILILLIASSSLFSLSAAFAQSMDISIDQIEFEGVRVIDQSDVESSLEVDIGDPPDRSRILKTIQNIQNLYRGKGYDNVSIESRLIRRRLKSGKQIYVLLFDVREGNPTRLVGIRIQPQQMGDEQKNTWEKLEKQLAKDLGFRIGDVIGQERITEITAQVESILSSNEFYGARVRDVQKKDAPIPSVVAKEDRKEASRWVILEVNVDLGDRVNFGFRGNTVLSKSELLEVVEEQRLVGFGKNYVRQIQRRIEERYKALGFARVVVKPYTFVHKGRERQVSYHIVEGPRVELESVQFDGNIVYEPQRLLEVYFDRSPILVKRGYYVETEVEAGAELLIDWLKSQGYLSAKLVTLNRTFSDDGKRARVTIYLYEGEQTLVRSIDIQGNQFFSGKKIKETLGIEEEKPLNLFRFTEGLETLKAEYRNEGFLSFSISNEDSEGVVTYFQRNRLADISVRLNEGHRYRVSSISIEGLTKTFQFIAKRELRFKEGDILEEWKVPESESRLRKLGIFGTVRILHRDDPEKVGYKQVKVALSEGTPGLLAGGVGIRNDLGVRVFGTAAYTNVWHRNHTISLSGSANRRFEDYCVGRSQEPVCFAEYQFRLAYIWPWFGLDELTFRPQLIQQKRRFNQFDAQTSRLQLIFEKPLLEQINLVGLLTYNLELTRQFNAIDEIDNQTLRIGSLIPALRLDLRDNPLAPTKGFFSTISYEFASPFFGSQAQPVPVSYSKIQFRADHFFPITPRIIWYASFRTGFVRNLVDPTTVPEDRFSQVGVPLIKRFALGGPGSLRGFKLQEINFQNLLIQGTMAFTNYRSQIDFPLAGNLKIGPFVDAGNLFADKYSLSLSPDIIRYSAGIGLHYQTPVGPVNFDWGFKLNRDPADPDKSESDQEFHFSVGIL